MIEIHVRSIRSLTNPLTSSGLFYHNSLEWSISNGRVSGYIFLLPCIIEILVFNANCVDPDQTSRSVASDLGLHCLPVNLLVVYPTKMG